MVREYARSASNRLTYNIEPSAAKKRRIIDSDEDEPSSSMSPCITRKSALISDGP